MLHSRARFGLLAPVVTLALSLALVVALTAPGTGAAGGQPRLTITFKGKDRIYKADTVTRVNGKLRGYPGGNGAQVLALLADPFPYGEYETAGGIITKANGRYSFQVAPSINTRYRVAAAEPGVKSKALTLPVYARVAYDLRTVRGGPSGIAVGSVKLRYSPDVSPNFLAGKPIHWYFQKTTQPVARRVKKTNLKKLAAGGVHGAVRYRLPASRNNYSYYLTFCVSHPPRDVGIGDRRPYKCKSRLRTLKAPGVRPVDDHLEPGPFSVPPADTRDRTRPRQGSS